MISKYQGKIPLESEFPYLGVEGKCHSDKWTSQYGRIKETIMIDKTLPTEQRIAALKEALVEGPVEVSIAVPESMAFYSGGVFNDAACGFGVNAVLKHAVTAIGWGTD